MSAAHDVLARRRPGGHSGNCEGYRCKADRKKNTTNTHIHEPPRVLMKMARLYAIRASKVKSTLKCKAT